MFDKPILQKKFLALCYFKSNVEEDRQTLIKNHQLYISQRLHQITFGGLLHDEDGKDIGLCIFVKANKKDDVFEILHNDPYYPLYQTVQVHRFSQRVPNQSVL